MVHFGSAVVTDNVDVNATQDKTETVAGDNNNERKTKEFKRYQLAVTFILFVNWICEGLVGSLLGTTLPDQRDRLNTTTDKMADIFSAAGFVSLASSLVNGVLLDVRGDHALAIMAGYLALAAVVNVASKYLLSYAAYFASVCIVFFCLMAVDTTGNVVILRLWGAKSSAPLYAIHLGYGVGSTIGPFLARPFLSKDDSSSSSNCTEQPLVTCPPSFEPVVYSSSRFPDSSRIEIPYCIVGAMMLATSAVLMLAHRLRPSNDIMASIRRGNGQSCMTSLRKVFNLDACAYGSHLFAAFFLTFIALFFFLSTGREITLQTYLLTYAVDSDLGFSRQDAALVDGIYNGCYMLGRLASIGAARLLSIQVLLGSELAMVTLFSFLLAVWGTTDKVFFVVCCSFIGFFGSPLWPGAYSWTDQYITLTATAFFIIAFGGSMGGILFNQVYGSIFKSGDLNAIMYIGAGCAVATLVLYGVAQAVGCYQGVRFKSVNDSNADEKDINVVTVSYSDINIQDAHSLHI